jgi:hypothetical protein
LNKIITVVGGVNGGGYDGAPGVPVQANGTIIQNSYGLSIDEANNIVYFSGYHLYAYNVTNGTLYVVSTPTNLGGEEAVAYDSINKKIYATRGATHQVVSVDTETLLGPNVTLNTGQGSTPPYGDGANAALAKARQPSGLAYDKSTNFLFMSGKQSSQYSHIDSQVHTIRGINLTNGIIGTYAGNPDNAGLSGDGGLAGSSYLNTPRSISLDTQNNIMYFTDSVGVRAINRTSNIIYRVAGVGTCGTFSGPGTATTVTLGCATKSVAFDGNNNRLYVSDFSTFIDAY